MAAAGVREELTCCACWEIYTDPVTLPCGHNFCLVCIRRILERMRNIEEDIFCPVCQRKYSKKNQPEQNINVNLCNIAERFHVTDPHHGWTGVSCTYCDSPVPAAKSCLLCEASLCVTHLRVHSKSPEHVLTEPTVLFGDRKCSSHRELLRYHCIDDGDRVCVSCCLAGKHRGHRVELLNETQEKIQVQVMAAADVRSELTCSVCREIYTDPVTLPCGHNFCLRCIERTWDTQQELFLENPSCPVCRQRYTRRPEVRIDKTLINIFGKVFVPYPEQEGAGILCTYCDSCVPAAKCCLHCEASLCDRHVRMHSKSVGHILIEPSMLFNNKVCSTHQKPLGYYCREDEASICEVCVPEHRGHRLEKLNKGFEKVKEKLRILQVMRHSNPKDQLSCSVCREIYTEPVTLPCGHNFCLRCIKRRWDWQDEIKEDLSCPECRQTYMRRPDLNRNQMLSNIVQRFIVTHPELSGPRDFCTYCLHSVVPSAVPATKSCLHCAASLCERHVTQHSQSPEHELTDPATRCSAHQELLRYFCTEDGARVCVSCCLAGEHRGHRVELLNEATEIRNIQGCLGAGLRDKLSCSMCRGIYKEPVTLQCGHNFCQDCIERTWDYQEGIEEEEPSCPECGVRCRREMKLRKNNTLCDIVQLLVSEQHHGGTSCTYCIHSLVPAAKSCLMCEASLCHSHLLKHSKSAEHVSSEPSASHTNCSAHRELLRYLCTEDGARVCVSCCLAGEHRGHRVQMFHQEQEESR
ncbi:uncharacterized protein LOC108699629 isoform X2 [Xenopus laevis]|nr:uncharacterized protein LOC108699629 isoform X2 [Xenopus laevis]XP_041429743.1 uncharacterized protein LOC108699629 isoform X2 [Xenopus laevis]OCT69534.1 hypothetical protein XELAEV_18040845mg [Xenopus laevis]